MRSASADSATSYRRCNHLFIRCYRIDWPFGWFLPRVVACMWCDHRPTKEERDGR